MLSIPMRHEQALLRSWHWKAFVSRQTLTFLQAQMPQKASPHLRTWCSLVPGPPIRKASQPWHPGTIPEDGGVSARLQWTLAFKGACKDWEYRE